MRADIDLDAGRARQKWRELVRDRGPDTGRQVDHLKERSRDGAGERLLQRYEQRTITADRVTALSRLDDDGLGGTTYFMYGVSSYGGSDGYGA